MLSLNEAYKIKDTSFRRKHNSLKSQRKLKVQSHRVQANSKVLTKVQRLHNKHKTSTFKKYSSKAIARRVKSMSETERAKFQAQMKEIADVTNLFSGEYDVLNTYVNTIKELLENDQLNNDDGKIKDEIDENIKSLHDKFKEEKFDEKKDATLNTKYKWLIEFVDASLNMKGLELEIQEIDDQITSVNTEFTTAALDVASIYDSEEGDVQTLPIEYKQKRKNLDTRKTKLEKDLSDYYEIVSDIPGKLTRTQARRNIIQQALTDNLPEKFCYKSWSTDMTSEPVCDDPKFPQYKRRYDRCSETCEAGAKRRRKLSDRRFEDKSNDQSCYETCDVNWTTPAQKEAKLMDLSQIRSQITRYKENCYIKGWSIYDQKETSSFWAYTVGLFVDNYRPLDKLIAKHQPANTRFTCRDDQTEWWGSCYDKRSKDCTVDYGMAQACGIFGCSTSMKECVRTYVSTGTALVIAAAKTTALVLTAGSSTAIATIAHVITAAQIVASINNLLAAWDEMFHYFTSIWEKGGPQQEALITRALLQANQEIAKYNLDSHLSPEDYLVDPDFDEVRAQGEFLYQIKKEKGLFDVDITVEGLQDFNAFNKVNTAYQNYVQCQTLVSSMMKETDGGAESMAAFHKQIRESSMDFVKGHQFAIGLSLVTSAVKCANHDSSESKLAECGVDFFKGVAGFDPTGISSVISSLIHPFCKPMPDSI